MWVQRENYTVPDFVKDELASGMAKIENFQMYVYPFLVYISPSCVSLFGVSLLRVFYHLVLPYLYPSPAYPSPVCIHFCDV